MARKSKRMALYEAIRQGQAKIAQGLESGQMRSDGTPLPQKATKAVSGKNVLLKKIDSLSGISALSKILAAAAGVTVVVIVLFVIWLVIRPDSQPEPPVSDTIGGTVSPQQSLQQAPVEEQKQTQKDQNSGFFGFGGKKNDQQTEPKPEPAGPSAEPGQNVIVIQQIHPQQQDKLLPVQKYYADHGIPTELIQRSGYSLLVTRTGFDHNPNREGSEGYRLMERIRQLGLVYPDKTGDTKFGLRPFQDAYALKK